MLAIYIGVQTFMMTYRYLDGVKNGKVIKKKRHTGWWWIRTSYSLKMTQDIRKKELERTSKDGKPAQLLVCNPIKLMWVKLDRSLKAKQHARAMHLWELCWVELNKITCTFDHLCTWCTWRWGLISKSCVNGYSIVRNVITQGTFMPIDQNKTWKRSKITTKTPNWIQTVAKQIQCVRMRNSLLYVCVQEPFCLIMHVLLEF